jgi:hypothetical protein
MDELSAPVVNRMPSGPVRNVHIQGGRVIFLVEEGLAARISSGDRPEMSS